MEKTVLIVEGDPISFTWKNQVFFQKIRVSLIPTPH